MREFKITQKLAVKCHLSEKLSEDSHDFCIYREIVNG